MVICDFFEVSLWFFSMIVNGLFEGEYSVKSLFRLFKIVKVFSNTSGIVLTLIKNLIISNMLF